jgi:hypothetical protein
MPIILTILGLTLQTIADEDLAAIVKSIESYESDLNRSELIYHSEYRLLVKTGVPQGAVVAESEEYRVIRQKPYRFVRIQTEDVLLSGQTDKKNYLLVYDGKKLKALNNESNVSITETPNPFFAFENVNPYTLPLSRQNISAPLSTLLKGTSELKKLAPFKNENIEAKIEGEETIDGLQCKRIALTAWRDRVPPAKIHYKLWLAVERNFLPIRFEDYNMMKNEAHPSVRAVSEDIREIEKGIWIPFKVVIRYFDPETFRNENKIVVANEQIYEIKKVDLNPNYPIETFQNVSIKEGAMVNTVKDGKIVDRYIKGLSSKTVPPRRTTTNSIDRGCIDSRYDRRRRDRRGFGGADLSEKKKTSLKLTTDSSFEDQPLWHFDQQIDSRSCSVTTITKEFSDRPPSEVSA